MEPAVSKKTYFETNNMPKDIFDLILLKLSFYDILIINDDKNLKRRYCKSENHHIWKQLYLRDIFNIIPDTIIPDTIIPDNISLKKNYLETMVKNNFKDILINLSKYGEVTIILKLIKKYASLFTDKDYNSFMKIVSFDGHIELIKLFIEHGATDYILGMINAGTGGHIELVKFFIDKGTDLSFISLTVASAIEKNHIQFVKACIELEISEEQSYDYYMSVASNYGHIELVKYFMELGATDIKRSLISAAETGYLNIIEFFITHGATDYKRAIFSRSMVAASRGGHKQLVEFFISKGVKNYKKAIDAATKSGHKEIVEILSEALIKSKK